MGQNNSESRRDERRGKAKERQERYDALSAEMKATLMGQKQLDKREAKETANAQA